MRNTKKLKDLTIRDNFLFAAVMLMGDNCKRFMEMLLGLSIDRVEVIYEKSIVYNPEYKGIRLDVYARDERNTCYNIEMQVAKKELGKRSRYYHSQMDMELIVSGHDHEELPESYVIFICDFDPFGEKKYCYRFEHRCLENLNLGMGDGGRTIFLNTRGEKQKEVAGELVEFLHFVRDDNGSSSQDYKDDYVRQLQQSIREVKRSREIGRQYMLLELMLKEEWKKGIEEGMVKGKAEAILELLEDFGPVPAHLRESIMRQTDLGVLSAVHKAAAKVESIEQFQKELSRMKIT